jgi:methylated-DNA-[protein]-cysteine S-methyltransferase
MNDPKLRGLDQAIGEPGAGAVAHSRAAVSAWFESTAPLINWDMVETRVGPIYLAVSDAGLCRLDFDEPEALFRSRLDPMARAVRNPRALAQFRAQLAEYFAGKRRVFDVPIDLRRVKPFQRSVLEAALQIPAGSYRTYQQVAQAIGRPKASRAVGQALARNPVAIFVPCHRVLARDGSLHGYAGGLERKRLLLQLEGTTIVR